MIVSVGSDVAWVLSSGWIVLVLKTPAYMKILIYSTVKIHGTYCTIKTFASYVNFYMSCLPDIFLNI